jgi:hypothetical protein
MLMQVQLERLQAEAFNGIRTREKTQALIYGITFPARLLNTTESENTPSQNTFSLK